MTTQVGISVFFPIVKQPSRPLTASMLNSKLVWEDHQSMVKLAERYRIQLVWVPRHMRTDGNEIP